MFYDTSTGWLFGVAPAGVFSPFRHRTAAVLRITHREGAPPVVRGAPAVFHAACRLAHQGRLGFTAAAYNQHHRTGIRQAAGCGAAGPLGCGVTAGVVTVSNGHGYAFLSGLGLRLTGGASRC